MTLQVADNSKFYNATMAHGFAIVVPQGWPIDNSVPTGCGGTLGPADFNLEVSFSACNATVFDIIGGDGVSKPAEYCNVWQCDSVIKL